MLYRWLPFVATFTVIGTGQLFGAEPDVMARAAALRKEGIVSTTPFADPIDFDEFDTWHYYGRTAKHGAFMGGADFVQWHGNYEILRHRVEIDSEATELRASHVAPDGGAPSRSIVDPPAPPSAPR